MYPLYKGYKGGGGGRKNSWNILKGKMERFLLILYMLKKETIYTQPQQRGSEISSSIDVSMYTQKTKNREDRVLAHIYIKLVSLVKNNYNHNHFLFLLRLVFAPHIPPTNIITSLSSLHQRLVHHLEHNIPFSWYIVEVLRLSPPFSLIYNIEIEVYTPPHIHFQTTPLSPIPTVLGITKRFLSPIGIYKNIHNNRYTSSYIIAASLPPTPPTLY